MGACLGRCHFATRAILEAALQQRCQSIFDVAGPCLPSKPLTGKFTALLSKHHDSPNLLNTALVSAVPCPGSEQAGWSHLSGC